MNIQFTVKHMAVLLQAHAGFDRLLNIMNELNGGITSYDEGPLSDLMNIEKLIQMISPMFAQENDKNYYDRAFTKTLYSPVLTIDEKARLLLEGAGK